MSRIPPVIIIVIGCLLIGLLTWYACDFSPASEIPHRSGGISGWRLLWALATTSPSLGIIILGDLAGKFMVLISVILFVIQGFRVHWGWGIANLLLFPFAGIVFYFRHEREARAPMLVCLAGVALGIVIRALVPLYGLFSNHLGPYHGHS